MDKYNLERFIKRQQEDYNLAYMEISRGRKESHWMWWIFPQIDGLGMSSTSRKYAIGSLEEAEAFLNHPYLGANLRNICEVLLGLPGKNPGKIFGSPDDREEIAIREVGINYDSEKKNHSCRIEKTRR